MNADSGEGLAWLADPRGNRIPVKGSCSLGRSASNQVAIPDDRVSRRHAMIQVQGENEFWLVDFGSRNGTYLNGQRLTRPSRLQSGDHIVIGHAEFAFHQRQSAQEGATRTILADRTKADIRQATCWLLVADVVGSTRLVKELPPDEVPLVMGQWVADCKQTIEASGGRVNQFMGDGFFAYWHDRERVETGIDVALKALQRLQEQARPAFRFVLHLAPVVIGGVSVGEEERISGSAVHFTFRMEKLAGRLDLPRLLSETAWARLGALVAAREAGRHSLPGFKDRFLFYTL
jgi:pSer/pThr/pTyr-binding forkhead associated (FHA) protein